MKRKFIEMAAIAVICSVTATAIALALTGSITSATASTGSSAASARIQQQQLQTLSAASQSLKTIARELTSRSAGTVKGELESISIRLGGKDGVVGSGGTGVLDYLWRIAKNTE